MTICSLLVMAIDCLSLSRSWGFAFSSHDHRLSLFWSWLSTVSLSFLVMAIDYLSLSWSWPSTVSLSLLVMAIDCLSLSWSWGFAFSRDDHRLSLSPGHGHRLSLSLFWSWPSTVSLSLGRGDLLSLAMTIGSLSWSWPSTVSLSLP